MYYEQIIQYNNVTDDKSQKLISENSINNKRKDLHFTPKIMFGLMFLEQDAKCLISIPCAMEIACHDLQSFGILSMTS